MTKLIKELKETPSMQPSRENAIYEQLEKIGHPDVPGLRGCLKDRKNSMVAKNSRRSVLR